MDIKYYMICSFILFCICVYTNINLLRKVEALRDRNIELANKIADTAEQITITLENMQRIDSKGAFQAVDEVGSIFAELKRELKTLSEI